MTTLYFITLACCLGVSFFLSGMEAGVFALSRFRIRRLIREGSIPARQLHEYLDHTEGFLWTIFIGNTLANFVATVLAVVMLHDHLGLRHGWFWLVFIAGGLPFYAAFDLLPKMLFRLYPNRLCLMFLRPFRVVHHVLRPVVWLMSQLSALLLRWSGGRGSAGRLFGTREELRHLMQDSARQMSSEERDIINRVLDLQTLTVGQVMVPLVRVVGVNATTPVVEVLRLCREHDITRLPVWREEAGRRRVAGLLNARSLIYQAEVDPRQTAGDYLKPAVYQGEDLCLEDAMRLLQRSGQRLAIVLNHHRQEVGVISLHDILKVVFGQFHL
jgi:CBS domain containing-hemolysin-like protein